MICLQTLPSAAHDEFSQNREPVQRGCKPVSTRREPFWSAEYQKWRRHLPVQCKMQSNAAWSCKIFSQQYFRVCHVDRSSFYIHSVHVCHSCSSTLSYHPAYVPHDYRVHEGLRSCRVPCWYGNDYVHIGASDKCLQTMPSAHHCIQIAPLFPRMLHAVCLHTRS